MVNNIGKDFKEEAKQVVEDAFKDFDTAIDEDEVFDEDHALDQVMNSMLEDLTEEEIGDITKPIEEPSVEDQALVDEFKDFDVTLTDGLEDLPYENSTESLMQELPGLIDRRPERRKIVKPVNISNRVKKGPLFDFKTNKNINNAKGN